MGKGFFERARSAWERVENVVGGAAGVVDGTVDIVLDTALTPFRDDEYDNFWEAFVGGAKKGVGQSLQSAFGPDSGLGAAIGGLPVSSVRRPLGAALEASEDLYGAGSRALARGIGYQAGGANVGTTNLLPTGSDIRRIDRATEGQSPGRVAAAGWLGADVRDAAAIEVAANSAWGQVISATVDGLLRWRADPSVIAGKAVTAARGTYRSADGLRSTTVRSLGDIDAAADSHRANRFLERVGEIKVANLDDTNAAAAKIRDEMFPAHAQGSVISTLLAQAPDLNAERLTLRALMGDWRALSTLKDDLPAQARMIHDMVSDAGDVIAREAGDLADVDDLDEIFPALDTLNQWRDGAGAIDTVPRARLSSQVRSSIARSDFYQTSAATRPVRVLTNMMPQHWLNLNDQRSDIGIMRVLRDANLEPDEQLALRGEYMAAATPARRQEVAIRIENRITEAVLRRHGATREEVATVIANASRLRDGALGALRKRVYDASGRGRVSFTDIDGTDVHINLPLHVTQQADLLPLVDVKALERAAKAAGEGGWSAFRLAHPSTNAPTMLLESFYSVWRPATLLRVGWPLRVLTDEQLRIVAKIGALGHVGSLRNAPIETADRAGSSVARRFPRDIEAVSKEAVESRALARYRGFQVDGVDLPGPFEGPGGEAMAKFNSSAGTWRELAGASEDSILSSLRAHTGSFKVFAPQETEHLSVWADVLNRQIGQSAFARFFVTNPAATADDGLRWLRSPEGVAYAHRAGWRADDLASHADDVHGHVRDYVPEPVRAALAEGDVDASVLEDLVPDKTARPYVHGEELAQALGDSELRNAVRNVVSGAWESLGRAPTDVWSRNPYFDHVYRAEATRLVNLLDKQTPITQDLVDQIATQARRKALNESQILLYDLAEKSQFAHMVRFLSPFYMPFQEVGTRWAGLAWDRPASIARMRLAWNAPEKAGLVSDENGNLLDGSGRARDPLTGDFVEAGKDRYITLPFQIPGLPTAGPVKFNQKSLNLLLTGSPGVGPPVQVAVNEIVKNRPDLADTVKFILPFGSTQEPWRLIVPASMRNLYTNQAGEEDRQYRNSWGRIASDRYTDYLLGKRDTPPSAQEITEATDQLYMLRTFASFVSPFAPIYDSPYQPYINAYRNAQARLRDDPEALGVHEDGTAVTADEWFLDNFGEEYFFVTVSFTESRDGVPPTAEGFDARERYQDLIERYPDIGGLIIGAEGAGEFARSVYDYQLAHAREPGSDVRQREPKALDDLLGPEGRPVDPALRAGWIDYGRFMDQIDNERVRRGLPNLQVAAASDLAEAKRSIIRQIGERYPEWFAEFNKSDRLAFTRRLEGLTVIAEDERLSKRPDIRGLQDYLYLREQVMSELAKRPSSTITSSANADLAMAWESLKAQVVERNPAFASLYYRYLERDPMEIER